MFQKNQLIEENARLKAKIEYLEKFIEELKADKKALNDNVLSLSEALVAKESPTAFSYQKASEMDAKVPPEDREAERRRKEEIKLFTEFAKIQEQDLFRDPDDMISMLMRGMDIETSAVHDNDES